MKKLIIGRQYDRDFIEFAVELPIENEPDEYGDFILTEDSIKALRYVITDSMQTTIRDFRIERNLFNDTNPTKVTFYDYENQEVILNIYSTPLYTVSI